MIDYVRRVNAQGGVVMCDVAVNEGKIYPPHLNQLVALRAAIRSQQ